MAFGSSPSITFSVGAFSVLKPNVAVSLTRTNPSQRWDVLPVALQLPLAANEVPYALL